MLKATKIPFIESSVDSRIYLTKRQAHPGLPIRTHARSGEGDQGWGVTDEGHRNPPSGGLGLSSRLPRLADHRVDRHGAAIAELVESLGLRDIILVGQDWGGPIAAQVGARMPERIAGAVFANTAVLVPAYPRSTAFHTFARMPVLSDLVFRGLGFPQNGLHRVQSDKRSIRGDVAMAYRWPLRTWKDRVAPLALARMVPDRPDHPSMEALRQGEAWMQSFSGPMALVWGTRDPILGRALRRHESAFPRAAVTRTEAGHFLQEEVPEALAAAVEDVARRSP